MNHVQRCQWQNFQFTSNKPYLATEGYHQPWRFVERTWWMFLLGALLLLLVR